MSRAGRLSGAAGAIRRGVAGALAGAALAASALAAAASDQSGGLLPVPSVTIARGETIRAEMLTEKHFYFDPSRPLSVLADPSAAIGKAAGRTLKAGKPIPTNAFRAVKLVRRGRLTEARVRVGNLFISATVVPQQDGGEGELIRARNVDTGRMVSGLVSRDGALEVVSP